MQPHHLHHHLVAVCRAIEGAGARAMVGGAFGFQQLVAPDLAFGIKLANAHLFLVGQARGHRTGRNEDGRKVTEAQRADQKAGHDLVADAEQQRAFEHRMRQRDGRAEGDGVAAEEGQVHARLSLRHAVAHGRHAASDLRGRADFARGDLDLLGIAAIGLMRRQHVIIGRDDADVHRIAGADHGLVLAARRKAMGEVAAGQLRAVGPGVAPSFDQVEIFEPAGGAALNDALGHLGDGGVKISHASLLRRVRSGQWPRTAPSSPSYRGRPSYWPPSIHR